MTNDIQIVGTYRSEIAARRGREALAAGMNGWYDPLEDTYLIGDIGKGKRLIIRKVEGKYAYQVICEPY